MKQGFHEDGLASAVDVVNVKLMTLDLAVDIARAAVEACRKDGYQVSVVVVDRSHKMREGLFRALRRSRGVIRRELIRRRQKARKALAVAQAEVMANGAYTT